MRRFFSYGPLDKKLHYFAPRIGLIESICKELLGDDPTQTGQYVTVWAPRQSGKTWVMQEVLFRLRDRQPSFDVVKLNLQDLQDRDAEGVYQGIIFKLEGELERSLPKPTNQQEFAECFSRATLEKPLIMILDEFDSLAEDAIRSVVAVLRNIYIQRQQQNDRLTIDKHYLLHSVALMGVRSVLGVENSSGSPFNIQRSVHIPNLTFDEMAGMFHWYASESGQPVESAVIERLYYETRGQPGLISWLGELLTETYRPPASMPISMPVFENVYADAINKLPNNNILNIISKARQLPYRDLVLELFQTDRKIAFHYDDAILAFLYMNGVIEEDKSNSSESYSGESYSGESYVRFSSPFVQKRLFNYFARDYFTRLRVFDSPFDDFSDTITSDRLYIPALMHRYEHYLKTNHQRLFADVPRRKTDDRIYEAIFHFHLYMYLSQFLASYEGRVIPEFPTGNGKIDLFLYYAGATYALEVKSFLNLRQYQNALSQAVSYGKQLSLKEIWLVLFVESASEENRRKYEIDFVDAQLNVTVHPLLVVTGR